MVNADGFGVGWFADGDPVPARYRQAGPIWADPIVRRRGPGDAQRRAAGRRPRRHDRLGHRRRGAAAPYAAATAGCSATTGRSAAIRARWPSSPRRCRRCDLLELESRTDSAFVWALILAPGARGRRRWPRRSPRWSPTSPRSPTARLNLLLMNDTTIVASVFGDTLSALVGDGFVVVASEPYDDSPGWADVAEGVHTWSARRPEAVEGHGDERYRDRAAAARGLLRGGAARRRSQRPDRGAEVAAAQVVLRRARQRAVRGDHPAAGVLPDARRAGDPRPTARPRSPR